MIKPIWRISKEWLNRVHLLSRNQILLMLLDHGAENNGVEWLKEYRDKIWRGRIGRFKKDRDIYKKISNGVKRMNIKVEMNNDQLKYFEIKEETFNIILRDNFSKGELLILIWILGHYSNKNYRVVEQSIHTALKEIFRSFKSPSHKRKFFFDTLDKFREIQYSNPTDRLVENYQVLDRGRIRIILTPKHSPRVYNKKWKKQ